MLQVECTNAWIVFRIWAHTAYAEIMYSKWVEVVQYTNMWCICGVHVYDLLYENSYITNIHFRVSSGPNDDANYYTHYSNHSNGCDHAG